jgi:uncharacterized membrane protein
MAERAARLARGSLAGRRATARSVGLGPFLVAVVGLAVAAYLTVEHYHTSTTLACPESATINCAKVTTSAWSHLGPVPVALLGLLYFAAMAAVCSPPAWRIRALDVVRVIGAGVGVASAIYLIWAELFRIDAICLWCTAVHACTVLLLGSVLWTTSALRSG